MQIVVEQTKAETRRAPARFQVKQGGKVVGRNLTVEDADALHLKLFNGDSKMDKKSVLAAIEANPTDAYRAHADADWVQDLEKHVPEHLRPGLVRWVLLGILPGQFLSAILENDLIIAVQTTDEESMKHLHSVVMFLVWGAPHNCFGNADQVARWKTKGGILGQKVGV